MEKEEMLRQMSTRLKGIPEEEQDELIQMYRDLFQVANENGKKDDDVIHALTSSHSKQIVMEGVFQMKKYSAGIRIGVSILLTFVIMAVVIGVLAALGRMDDLFSNYPFMMMMAFVLAIPATILPLVMFKMWDQKNPWKIGWHFKKKDMIFSVVAVLLSFTCVISFILILDGMDRIEAGMLSFNQVKFSIFLIACIGYFFAALKEEVLVRAYFMSNLSKLGMVKMILISSILFTCLHFPTGGIDPFRMGSWFVGGLVFAYIYLKSGSVVVATVVHAVHNLVNDMAIHGAEGVAIFTLNQTVSLSDKLFYEVALGLILVVLTYGFYGKNGVFTPAQNLIELWGHKPKEKNDAFQTAG
ncbi:hypothetical protein GCM10008967_10300 [Bacillus carboniphilus]|uniref:CAAX prenyl protease 2/Lysostaphin resistance protein A-like domain-containing protein n=1 Tax=Bacillus carboniphilus TaxID=86663 RepID=A0ABN0W0B6_9BACI